MKGTIVRIMIVRTNVRRVGWRMLIDKYIGRCIKIIYRNRRQQVSQRTIRISLDGILSVKPVISNVS